jgi:hypothetical protein
VIGNTNNGTIAGGGGLYNAKATNCVVAGNYCFGSQGDGGGAFLGNLVNCTITGNSASFLGGGTAFGTQINCINFFNICNNKFTPSTNYYTGSFLNCCTTPLPGGNGNITNDPALASNSHISLNSPCRGAGLAAAASGVDIDGHPWANPPSIGCDEPNPGSITGQISLNIAASDTNRAVGYAANFQANISGPVSASKWDFGDGTTITNEPYTSHSWNAIGNYPVVLTAYNDSYPTGQTASLVVHVYQPTTFYVVASNQSPVAPYDTWAKAATNIQNAIDVAIPGSTVLVSNGVYKIGSRISSDGGTNRVVVAAPLALQSVNGFTLTSIDGGGSVRCIYLTNGASLNGFTLFTGATANGVIYCASTNALVQNCLLVSNLTFRPAATSGTFSNCAFIHNNGYAANQSTLYSCTVATNWIGAEYSALYNCLITSNIALGAQYCSLTNCMVSSNGDGGLYRCTAIDCSIIGNMADNGAGAVLSTLTNCLLVGNYAGDGAGGAWESTLYNCTVAGNSARWGGGVAECTLYNSILYDNVPDNGGGGPFPMQYCCTTPLVAGVGNITNDPVFVNLAGGDFHLQPYSPCINSGDNIYVTTASDLDGNPRIVGGRVDIGAYEYQTPSSVLSYAWAQQYGLPTDGSADYLDLDGTGMPNWQKSLAGLNPTNSASVLAMLPMTATNNAGGIIVSWDSVNTRMYYLQRATDLTAQPVFSTIQSNLVGQAGTTSFTDTSATNSGPYFYRVGVQ